MGTLITLALVAMSLLTSGCGGHDSPQLAAGVGRIAFSAARAGDPRVGVFIVNADCSQGRRLADGYMPAWSPDGSHIAYGDLDFFDSVCVMNADGTGVQSLAIRGHGESMGTPPAWSPDGERIAFEDQREGLTYEAPPRYGVRIIAPDGTAQNELPDGTYSPAWSPDGAKLAFQWWKDGRMGLFVAQGTWMNALLVADGGLAPAWSPDGTRLLFRRIDKPSDAPGPDAFGVYTVDAEGTGERRLGAGNQAAWCPDGSRIAFISAAGEGSDVFVMQADGTLQARLTRWGDAPGSHAFFPTWSPDGSRLAYVLTRGSRSDLMLMSADGSTLGSLAHVEGGCITHPAWQPQ